MSFNKTREWKRKNRLPIEERFWDRVEKHGHPKGCWIFQGTSTGYHVQVRVGGRGKQYAHRVVWELTNGKIPEGKIICHTCDTYCCVKPSHLYLGTHKENARDRENRSFPNGRPRITSECYLRGSKHPSSKLEEQDIRSIRQLNNLGYTQKSLASMFGVNSQNISSIVTRKTWRHVK